MCIHMGRRPFLEVYLTHRLTDITYIYIYLNLIVPNEFLASCHRRYGDGAFLHASRI